MMTLDQLERQLERHGLVVIKARDNDLNAGRRATAVLLHLLEQTPIAEIKRMQEETLAILYQRYGPPDGWARQEARKIGGGSAIDRH